MGFYCGKAPERIIGPPPQWKPVRVVPIEWGHWFSHAVKYGRHGGEMDTVEWDQECVTCGRSAREITDLPRRLQHCHVREVLPAAAPEGRGDEATPGETSSAAITGSGSSGKWLAAAVRRIARRIRRRLFSHPP